MEMYPFNFERLVKKIKSSMDNYSKIYNNFELYHEHSFTFERFTKDKLKRKRKFLEIVKDLEENNPKKYLNHFN